MMIFTINNQDVYEITSFVYTFQKNAEDHFELTIECHFDKSVIFEDLVQDIKTNFHGYFKITDNEQLSHEFNDFVFDNLRMFIDVENSREKSITFIKEVD